MENLKERSPLGRPTVEFYIGHSLVTGEASRVSLGRKVKSSFFFLEFRTSAQHSERQGAETGRRRDTSDDGSKHNDSSRAWRGSVAL